jgi:DNA (cytosine-5)-methyltransferase 1
MIRLFDDEGCIDGFAGGGGVSTGIEMILGRSPDVAINHDAEALSMHETNHPATRHVHSNIRAVRYQTLLPGQRCGFAWFSPDCTYHSKARGGKPFRDRNRTRRIRGLAWEAVRCAEAIRPRLLFLENVEEWKEWGPIGADGRPDPEKRGASFRRWVSRLRNLGYVVEWRELRACDFGAPTSRKRLFVIARCDGQPICWPKPTHGPARPLPYRTAAECIDWSLPVPSIFLTRAEAKAWGKRHGVASPIRPLAAATQRRIARGIQRFVLDAAEPFIIPITHQGDSRVHSLFEPLRTITAADREFALVTPFITKYHGPKRKGDERVHELSDPIATLDTSNRFALVAPTLINTRNGERHGRHGEQAPRVLDIQRPLNTITAHGSQGALVAAFLAKHNGGHEATGQPVQLAMDTITTRDNKALVTSHLVKLRGGLDDHLMTAQDIREPIPALTAGGTHLAEVRAFLVKFYGTKKDGRPLQLPLDTVTTVDRFGLVTVTIAGEEYVIVDIGMRMLTPRELFRAQGFPADYQIDSGIHPTTRKPVRFTKKAQTRLVGNSVAPDVAAALIGANVSAFLEATA